MKRIIAATLAAFAIVATAFALPSDLIQPLWPSQHDGISLNFATQTYYTRAPGAPAQYRPFTTIFPFARGARAASYLNSSGVIGYANENTAIQTQTFDSVSWTKGNATVTADATTAPDGTTTADALVEDATVGVTHLVSQSQAIANVNQTFSVYLKAGTRTWAAIQLGSFAAGSAYFNLSTCAPGTTASGVVATGQVIGNGWCRVMVRGVAANANDAIYAASADNTVTYNGNSSTAIYMWGAQVQMGMVAQDYLVATATQRFDQPRIEYQSTTSGMNFVPQSQTLDNASWSKFASSVTANGVAAPDGTTTADKIVEDGTTNFHGVTITPAGFMGNVPINTPLRYSVYALASGRSKITIQTDSTGGTGQISCDLSSVGTSVSGIGSGASIQDVGGGWYRCQGTMTASATGAMIFKLILGSSTYANSYAGDSSSGVYAWGAQIEYASAAGTYTATTSTVPLFTNSTPTALGLLIENSRTNLGLQSEAFGAAEWTVTQAAITSDSVAAPDGATTADFMKEDATLNVHGIRVTTDITITANSTNTMSVFFRPAGRNEFYLKMSNVADGNGVAATCNAATGVATANNFGTGSGAIAQMVSYPGGWWRCIVTGAINNADTLTRPRLRTLLNATESYTGDNASGVYLWGFQFESGGAMATSYIPTTTASVTRNADYGLHQLGSEFSQLAGTVVVAGRASGGQDASLGQLPWAIDDNTANERYTLTRPAASDAARFIVVDGGVSQAAIDGTFTNWTTYKSAAAWALNDFTHYFNGALASIDTSGTLPTPTQISMGSLGASSQANGHILTWDYYPVRKGDGFLQRSSVR